MIRTAFNDDWRVRPKVNPFMEMVGGGAQPWVAVRLPARRDDRWDARPGAATRHGYFPGGVWEYQKTFVVPETHRGKRVLLEFEGVYRSAMVYVNGTLVGHRPYGYSDFAVSIGEHLRYGEENDDPGRWRPRTRTPAGTPAPASTGPCTSSSANRCTSRSTACT